MSSKLALSSLVGLVAAFSGCGSDDAPDVPDMRAADVRALDAAGVDGTTSSDMAALPDAFAGDSSMDASGPADAGVDLGAPPDSGPTPPRVTSALITDEHRFVPGAMFGGWGPHLGHLVRLGRTDGSGTDLYWVDDLCTQGTGDCDVNVNRRIGVFRRDDDEWTSIGRIPLPAGVQQNTGTIATGNRLLSFGIDTASHVPVQCTFDVASATSLGCGSVGLAAGNDANYVGAALSPTGAKVVWWTNVVDGGGGQFSYIVEYTVGWNGPRGATLPGYGDCGYVNAAFPGDGAGMTLFGQVVTGRAPAWVFSTLVREADSRLSVPVGWTNALAPLAGDQVASTNDLWIDPTTGDAHLIARTASGAATYYFRPHGGAFGVAQTIDPSALRARWLVTDDTITIVYGPNTGGLRSRSFPRSAVVAGTALEIASVEPQEIAVPDDLGPVVGLYPEAQVYQSAAVPEIAFVVVGTTRQNEAVFFEVTR